MGLYTGGNFQKIQKCRVKMEKNTNLVKLIKLKCTTVVVTLQNIVNLNTGNDDEKLKE